MSARPSASRLALVTGASSPEGIGYATAVRLAASGCRVAIVGTTARIHERAEALRSMGADAVSVACDLTDPAAVDALIAGLGRVDVLVNNAGMASGGVIDAQLPLASMSLEQWNQILARNLTTAFLVSRACVPAMQAAGYGRIVNVSSTTGAVAGVAGDSAYAAAKAAMLGMTRSLCLEVAKSGITVNAVAPGWIATGSQTEAERRAGAATPLARSGTADEVAATIAFLCDEAASYVTGQLIIVDGGNSVQEFHG
jgi:3-oxoacyl-[acyl-carrier protein] reductase